MLQKSHWLKKLLVYWQPTEAYKILKNSINSSILKKDWKEATRQLFKVALGLEAQVIGDLQIINQIKRAYQQAANLNTIGPFLHRILHTIFFTNKRVVQETAFRMVLPVFHMPLQKW